MIKLIEMVKSIRIWKKWKHRYEKICQKLRCKNDEYNISRYNNNNSHYNDSRCDDNDNDNNSDNNDDDNDSDSNNNANNNDNDDSSMKKI